MSVSTVICKCEAWWMHRGESVREEHKAADHYFVQGVCHEGREAVLERMKKNALAMARGEKPYPKIDFSLYYDPENAYKGSALNTNEQHDNRPKK